MAPSLLAPPSSPASFTNSALPSTAPSPNCVLSLSENSPGAPTMFAPGPYAHETQLVSPPVFSTFTTEPSTAPLTPPPELAHLNTPSSPDVPFAQFLSSSLDLKGGSGKLFAFDKIGAPPMEARDSNFFSPATFAQFYLDPPLPHTGGRLSVSKDSDIHSTTTNGYQTRQNKAPKQDVEELEAYRASFGFSADEITTTSQYVEITDVADESFTMTTPFASTKSPTERRLESVALGDAQQAAYTAAETPFQDHKLDDISRSSSPGNCYNKMEKEEAFSKLGSSYPKGLSCSDAEVDYGRVGSFKGCNGGFSWRG